MIKDIVESKVNIAALRMQLVELMKDGFTEIPIKELLTIITMIVKENEPDAAPLIFSQKVSPLRKGNGN